MSTFAICGDSGTGKTTMAETLARHLSNAVVLECDRYHKWEREDLHWKEFTHLNPEANELDLMNQDVQTLKDGKGIFRRNYNHDMGTFTQDQEVKSADNVIACGLHTFMCPEGLYDVKIFMDTDPTLKAQWKISRDIGKRGYSLEQARAQIENRQEDYALFLEPLALDANIVVNFRNETDLYTDSIKGIGRFLRVFIKEVYRLSDILREFSNLGVDYIFCSENSSRPGFWQIDIKHIHGGYYYDYIVMCILGVLKQNASS
jgi:uridine kinase